MKRPILKVLIPLILGIAIFEFIQFNISLIIVLFFAACIFYSKFRKNAIISIISFALAIIVTSVSYPNQSIEKFKDDEAEIYLVKEKEFSNDYYIKMDGKNYLMKSKEKFFAGDIVSITGGIEEIKTYNNFKSFNRRRQLKTKKVFDSINAKKIVKISESGKIKYKIIKSIERFYKERLNNTGSQFLSMMLLTKEGDLDLFDDFRELGLAHVLAVSGIHISVIISLLDFIGRGLTFKKNVYSIFTISFLLFYGYLIDFPVSLIRSLTMYIGSVLAIYTDNVKDNLNSIYLSMVICLLLNPFYIYSAAFYLSFSAIFSLYYFSKKIENIFPKVPEFLILALSLQISMLPIVVYFFNKVNLLSIILNIVVIPLISIVLLMGVIFFFIRIPVFSLLINGVFTLIELIIEFTKNGKENYEINFQSFSLDIVVIYYLFLIAIINYRYLFYLIKKSRNAIYLIFIISMILMKILFLPVSTVNIIDMGQAESILIRSKGKNILVDTGGNYLSPEISVDTLYQYLLKNGVKKIDYVIISHDDIDHSGNLKELAKKIYIDRIISNDELAIKTETISKGTKINLTDINLHCLYDGMGAESSNDSSLVFLLKIFNTSFLLTGDIEKGEENIKIDEVIDYLKVSHHGSVSSTSEVFLERNRYKHALISVGKNNSYGHPHKEVLKRLEDRGIDVSRTDIDGNIEIRINRFASIERKYNEKMDIGDLILFIILF